VKYIQKCQKYIYNNLKVICRTIEKKKGYEKSNDVSGTTIPCKKKGYKKQVMSLGIAFLLCIYVWLP